ncbi:GGDEF domain-containing protein [Aliiglaciecola litoralis]|uniref:diguanylate cyclase n=1 Tax=Aliiglaciecola litoralis TaxID=582857 RepID=A0ABN1LE77_9ALTE
MPENNLARNLSHKDKDVVFLNVLRIGIIVILVLWIVEKRAGLTHYFDDIGYGLTIVMTTFFYILSRFFNRTRLAKILVFIYVACYLLMLAIVGFIQAAQSGEIYSIASTLQWVPIIYILAFLFLNKRLAIVGALTVYLILVCMLFMTYTGLFPVHNPELRVLMVNMGLAHGLYIVCMYAVMRLRQASVRQTVKAMEMEQAANLDALLNIANRRYLQSLMDRHVKESKAVSILLLDVDHFKQINDTYGHTEGDEVLKKVVLYIKQSLRPVDVFGRWGGEEFLILADVQEEENALSLANRIRHNVATQFAAHEPSATISIGVAEYDGSGDIENTLNYADKALYLAKERGRNQVVMHHSGVGH